MILKEIEPNIYLRQVRERANLTQDQLADRMNPALDQDKIHRYEIGTQEPGVTRYLALIAACVPNARIITSLESDHGE